MPILKFVRFLTPQKKVPILKNLYTLEYFNKFLK